MKVLLAAGAALCAMASQAQSATYTVGGANPNFTTLQAAANVTATGDVVVVRPGTYTSGFTEGTSGVVYRSEQRHAAIINVPDFAVGGGAENVTLKGFIIRGTSRSGTDGRFTGMVEIRTGWVLEDSVIERSDAQRECIRLAAGHIPTANNIRIRRTIIQDCGGNGMWGRAQNADPTRFANLELTDVILRRNNRMAQNPGDHASGTKLMYTDGLRANGLIAYDNNGAGFWMDFGSRNYLIENSTFFGNHGLEPSPELGVGYYTEANPGPGGVFRNNVSYSNTSDGILIAETQNVIVQSNVFTGNPNAWRFRACCASSGRLPPSNIDILNNQASGNQPTGPGSDIVISGTQPVVGFQGPLTPVSIGPAFQVTRTPETQTIDAAMGTAVVGDTVTVPAYGRKAILDNGDGTWSTVIYDLSGRYVTLLLGSQADRDDIASRIPQYATVQGRDVTFTLTERTSDGYIVAGEISGDPPPVDTTPPSVPQGLTATVVSNSRVDLTWQASTDDVGVVGYDVFRQGVQIASVTITSHSDAGLAAGTYTYQVRAKDAAGNLSEFSAPATATITVTEPPPVNSADIKVSAADHDAEYVNGSLRNNDRSDLEMVLQGSNRQHVCVLLTGLPIPPGATVTLAQLQFTADSGNANKVSSGTGNLLIRALAADQPLACDAAAWAIDVTTAGVTWSSVPAWAPGAKTAAQLTPNLAPVVQEVADRINWGGNIAFWVTSDSNILRNAESFEGFAAKAAVLHVEWTD